MLNALLLLAIGTGSSTLIVPTDYATIQAAIDAAVAGDHVLVLPGNYAEQIDFLGKDIVVESADGPGSTALIGEDSPPKVSMISGEGPKAVLRGFTIRDGNDHQGAAIRCIGSSPRIEGNIIRSNHGGMTGGAVYCLDGSPLIVGNEFTKNTEPGVLVEGTAAPLIVSNSFYRNEASGISIFGGKATIRGNAFVQNAGAQNGAGVRVQISSSVLIENNLFVENRGNYGGGVFVASSANVDIRGNEFYFNDTYLVGHDGGAVYVNSASATIESNVMYGNRAYDGAGIAAYVGSNVQVRDNVIEAGWAFKNGGAIRVSGSVAVIERNRLARNECYVEPGFTSYCGGVAVAGVSDLTLRQCEISGSTATRGGAIYITGIGTHVLSGLTLVDDTATVGGILETTSTPAPTLESSILWGNTGTVILDGSGLLAAAWCDVQGGWAGTAIVDVDPQFVDGASGDYRLAAGSPCVDAGDRASVPIGLDASGAPRYIDGDLDFDVRIDLGAYERTHVRMTPIESVAPGGTFVLEATGEPGLLTVCALGVATSELFLEPWGALLLDPLQLIIPVHVTASLPFSLDVTVAPDYAGPSSSWFQTIVLDSLTGAGNFSNRVQLLVE
jgi:hypothetical protein